MMLIIIMVALALHSATPAGSKNHKEVNLMIVLVIIIVMMITMITMTQNPQQQFL